MTLSLDRMELAWAAGFWDGEGCVTVCRRKEYTWALRAEVGNSWYTNLERFQNAVGGLGKIDRLNKREDHHKTYFIWRATSFEAMQAVMCMLWPMISYEKRAQFKSCTLEARRHNKDIQVYKQRRPKVPAF